jgi:predicted CopG family antitoxin
MCLKLRQITVSQENYLTLKSMGKAGDSFNDVVSGILKILKQQQTDSGVGRSYQSVADHNTAVGAGCRHE